MENHSTQSQQKKNGGRTKRSLPALKPNQGPLLQGLVAPGEHVWICITLPLHNPSVQTGFPIKAMPFNVKTLKSSKRLAGGKRAHEG